MPAAWPFSRSSMSRSFIMDEIFGSSASATFVRSTYEIVYMISATGMRRSQRCGFTGFKLGALLTEEHGAVQWLTFAPRSTAVRLNLPLAPVSVYQKQQPLLPAG